MNVTIGPHVVALEERGAQFSLGYYMDVPAALCCDLVHIPVRRLRYGLVCNAQIKTNVLYNRIRSRGVLGYSSSHTTSCVTEHKVQIGPMYLERRTVILSAAKNLCVQRARFFA